MKNLARRLVAAVIFWATCVDAGIEESGPGPEKSRLYMCNQCKEISSAMVKTFPCVDGELCGFNCGELCVKEGDKKSKAEELADSFVSEKSKEALKVDTPCDRGLLCSQGLEKFQGTGEEAWKIRALVEQLTMCNVKPYAVCSALHLEFPKLQPTCHPKDCRKKNGKLIDVECTGIKDHRILTSDLCEKDYACEAVKNPLPGEDVSDTCYACYWIAKTWPVFTGEICSRSNEIVNLAATCDALYSKFNIDSDDINPMSSGEAEPMSNSGNGEDTVAKAQTSLVGQSFLEKQESYLRSKKLGAHAASRVATQVPDPTAKCESMNPRNPKAWFVDTCRPTGAESLNCEMEKCRGEGSKAIKPGKAFKNCMKKSKRPRDEQMDECYRFFHVYSFSLKSRALIHKNQEDSSVGAIEAMSGDMAACSCMGVCPFTSAESSTLNNDKCLYDPDAQRSEMEDLTHPPNLYIPKQVRRTMADFQKDHGMDLNFRFPVMENEPYKGWSIPTEPLKIIDLESVDCIKPFWALNIEKGLKRRLKCGKANERRGGLGHGVGSDDKPTVPSIPATPHLP